MSAVYTLSLSELLTLAFDSYTEDGCVMWPWRVDAVNKNGVKRSLRRAHLPIVHHSVTIPAESTCYTPYTGATRTIAPRILINRIFILYAPSGVMFWSFVGSAFPSRRRCIVTSSDVPKYRKYRKYRYIVRYRYIGSYRIGRFIYRCFRYIVIPNFVLGGDFIL